MAMAEESSLMTMESKTNHTTFTRKRPVKHDKLCLEDYLHFLHSRQTLHLTMNQLNQIIRIHGFKKIHHAPKKVLVDAVDSLDLMDLPRSTIRESVTAFAVLTLDDVVADLADLNWQECCVTSVEKLCSSNHDFFPASSSSFDRSLHVLANHSLSQTQLAPPKVRRFDEVCGLIPEAFRSSMRATKMVPKRKRSSVHVHNCAASTVDSVSLASC